MSQAEQEIQISADYAKQQVRLGQAAERLSNNKDFRLLVEEAYYKQEPVRLVAALSNPGLQSPESQAAIISDMRSINAFQEFILNTRRLADHAKGALERHEEELERIRRGGDEE